VAESLIQNYKMGILNGTDLVKPSLSNQYQVYISGVPQNVLTFLENYEVGSEWINRNVGLLCAEATLPTSSFATAEVKDNFQGINQQFAHTRLYVDTDFTFYVDYNYNMIKFFEGWMDYISGQDRNTEVTARGFYRRFNYPEDYKTDNLTITKFEKDYKVSNSYLQYDFINAFPKQMLAMPVSYGSADLVKCTVSFAYDRYFMNVRQKSNPDAGIEELTPEPKPKTAPQARNTDGTIITRGGTKIPQGNFKSGLGRPVSEQISPGLQ